MLEFHATHRSLLPCGEPQLSRRGPYQTLGAQKDASAMGGSIMRVLWLADGDHQLIAIADRTKLPIAAIAASAKGSRTAGSSRGCSFP